ncbi:hypothetical protein DSO57_1032378 [Entomophthora muscae]|uniref:Uncharacterized protein n=1 Tax=Entomophthora muscae TaxID=34485 RepID=A0ACC2RF50_9FUNG|nr:hypothetical protein DSO57_1032378 [Entomophthora muscae]
MPVSSRTPRTCKKTISVHKNTTSHIPMEEYISIHLNHLSSLAMKGGQTLRTATYFVTVSSICRSINTCAALHVVAKTLTTLVQPAMAGFRSGLPPCGKKDSSRWLHYTILIDVGIDPFNDPAVQADFARHRPTIVARCTVDTSARHAPNSLRAAYAPRTTLSTTGPARHQTQPANYTAVPPAQPAQPQSFVPASEPMYAQPAPHAFTPVDFSDRMGSPYPPTEHTFEGENNEDWDEIVAEPRPAPANAPASDFQEYNDNFIEDDEQVFNAPTPAPHCEDSQRPYVTLQGVCASMHNLANQSHHVSGTSH